MKNGARILRYCQAVQFMVAVYIKRLQRGPSQYIEAFRQGLRVVVEKNSGYRFRGLGTCVWMNSRYAFLFLSDNNDDDMKKIVIRKRGSNDCRVTVYCDRIFPVFSTQPIVFINELSAFNLFNKGLQIEDAFVECCVPSSTANEAENTLRTSSKAHISIIVTSFYDETIDYSKELREYFLTPRIAVVGDVIAIPWHKPWSKKTVDIFFKIIRLGDNEELSEAFIDSRKATLYQDEEIYDRIPYSDVTCYVPEKFSVLAKRISSLITASATGKLASPLVILLSGLPGSGKKLFLKHLSSLTHLDVRFFSCFNVWSDASGTYEMNIRDAFEEDLRNSVSMLAFLNADLLGYDANAGHDARVLTYFEKHLKSCTSPVVFLVCNRDKLPCIPASLRMLVLYCFEIPLLTEEDRKCVIIRHFGEGSMIDVAAICRHTSGFTLSDLHILFADAQFRQHNTNSPQLKTDHFLWAIDARNKSLAEKIGAPIIPKVTWDDIGGLEEVKQIVIESLIVNLKGRENMKRNGVLLYGPPGCGKTLIAKAIANQFKVTFLSVKGPELLNKYVGQSEANVRKVFEKARMAAPCVLFFDELDSLASNRGRCNDSSRVANNIVSQLTAELDCLEDSKIFILGATNRPDLLDSSLLRPGRFDKIVEVGGTRDVVSRERVLRAAGRNVTFDDDVNLEEIAHLCGHLSSGADLHMVISRAQMDAIRKRIHETEAGLALSEEKLLVTQGNLRNAVEEVTPSLGINYGQLCGL